MHGLKIIRDPIAQRGLAVIGGCLFALMAVPAWGMSVTLTGVSTADNYYDLYVDNSLVMNVPSQSSGWNTPETWSGSITTGQQHSISVEAFNYTPWSGYNPAAFIAQADAGPGQYFQQTNGQLLVTNDSWMVWYGGPNATPPLDINGLAWTDPNYTEGLGWVPATEIGANGIAPWGVINGISSSADWIWSSNWGQNSGDDGGAQADSPVYFRMTLTPDTLGGASQSIPEPATMMGMLLGVGALGRYWSRKRRIA